ncbi:MAG TPA: PLP-dependent aminotransferase family protein [Candidatus Dormibacteraeota bacterium]|nr:PLP-dependent aminotransferase family protein [Candidatus Dormibacteraeota bacterium]
MSQTRTRLRAKTKLRRLPASLTLLSVQVDRGQGRERLYQQIRESIRDAILSGQIAGRLPPTREMAAALGVNRATVARAYQELEADGLVESSGARGTVVVAAEPATSGGPGPYGPGAPSWVSALPPVVDSGLRADPTLIRDITNNSRRPEFISFAEAAPGPELIPAKRIAQAISEGLARSGPRVLGYAPVEGLEILREALTQTLAKPLLRAGESVMVVSGATQGLALAARALIERGDEVAVEAPTYFGILQTFGLAGARLIGIPADRHGMRIDQLESLLSQRRVRLIIVQSRFQNPTGALMSPERRAHLMLVARRHAVPVLEDDIYGALDLDGGAPPPLKQDDQTGSVVYVSSFSKSISPGIRVGWVVGPQPVINRMVVAKQFSDLSTNTIGQMVVADLLATGDYASHIHWLAGEYRTRRTTLLAALSALAGRVDVTFVPGGGSHLWCRLGPGLESRSVAAAAIRRKVALTPGEAFYPPTTLRGETGQDRVRLSFTAVPPERMEEGIHRLAEAIESLPAVGAGLTGTTGVLV